MAIDSEMWSTFAGILSFIITHVIATLTFAGNLFILYVIRRKRNDSITYLLISGQCFADFLVAITFVAAYVVCSDWFITNIPGGRYFCTIRFILEVSTYVTSAIFMMTIAFERFLRIYFPHRTKWSRSKTWKIMLIIYLVGFGLAWIESVGAVYSVFFPKTQPCLIFFEDLSNTYLFKSKIAFTFFLALHLVIPMISATCLYISIVVKLNRYTLQRMNTTANLRDQAPRQMWSTIKMLIAIMTCYYLLASPIAIFSAIAKYNSENAGPVSFCSGRSNGFSLVFLFVTLALMSTAVNPFILVIFNKIFKDELWRMCGLRSTEVTTTVGLEIPQNGNGSVDMNSATYITPPALAVAYTTETDVSHPSEIYITPY